MDCLNRAFAAGLRYCGLPTDDLPVLRESDDLMAIAETYGLSFLWKGAVLQEGNHPVLVAYLDDSDATSGEYHAVFASDQAPFARWNVHCAVVGWDDLAVRSNERQPVEDFERPYFCAVRALRHLKGKNHAFIPLKCDGCKEVALFLTEPGYRGDEHNPIGADCERSY